MKNFPLTPEAIPALAKMMSTLKPEWWDYEGAYGQLSDIGEAIKTVGWYCGADPEHPKGWILCRELVGLRALELECCGYDDDGVFKLEHKLGSLLEAAEAYARQKGYLTFRSGISSIGFPIHGSSIDNIPEAIASLQSDRVDYLWYLAHGFRPIGIQPNAYEKGFHLIILAKDLS